MNLEGLLILNGLDLQLIFKLILRNFVYFLGRTEKMENLCLISGVFLMKQSNIGKISYRIYINCVKNPLLRISA